MMTKKTRKAFTQFEEELREAFKTRLCLDLREYFDERDVKDIFDAKQSISEFVDWFRDKHGLDEFSDYPYGL